jgi:hypothetical protein
MLRHPKTGKFISQNDTVVDFANFGAAQGVEFYPSASEGETIDLANGIGYTQRAEPAFYDQNTQTNQPPGPEPENAGGPPDEVDGGGKVEGTHGDNG